MSRSPIVSNTVTLFLAVAGVVAICVAAPINGFLLGNSFIAGDFMPVAAMAVVFLVVLGIDPLLRRFVPIAALSGAQRAFIFGVMLVACVTPEAGLLRNGPNMLARESFAAARTPAVAEVYDALQPPAALFPDPLKLGGDTPVADAVIDELSVGESIAWARWLPPLLGWGTFLIPYWLMLAGMALIVLPQWRDNERQPMPLLKIQQMIVGEPRDGHYLPPLFCSPVFWTCTGLVFGLHLMSGVQSYFPGRMPAIPLSWNLTACFTEGFARNLPGLLKSGRISFIFLGLAFFMPSRTGFSIWAMQIIYGVGVAYAVTYSPPYDPSVVEDHRSGAVIAIAIWVLWAGRRHWRAVFGTLVRRDRSVDDGPNRMAAVVFLSGLTGMLCWLVWVGVTPAWAVVCVLAIFLNALVVTRMVSETGIPVAPYVDPTETLMQMVPTSLKTVANVYYGALCSSVMSGWNRVCAATMIMQGAGMDERTTARGRVRLVWAFLLVLLISLVVAGTVHVVILSHNTSTLNERSSPIGRWGGYALQRSAVPLVRDFVNGTGHNTPPVRRLGSIGTGMGIAGVLQLFCQIFPRWPLHPVALLFVLGFFAKWLWVSVFLGWFCKVMILRYGGSQLHQKAGRVFLGLVLGEVMAVVFWTAVTGVLAALGMNYNIVSILPD